MKPLLLLNGKPMCCGVCQKVFTKHQQYRWVSLGGPFSENERVCRGSDCGRRYFEQNRAREA